MCFRLPGRPGKGSRVGGHVKRGSKPEKWSKTWGKTHTKEAHVDLFVQDLLSHILMITRRMWVRIQCIALSCSKAISVFWVYSNAHYLSWCQTGQQSILQLISINRCSPSLSFDRHPLGKTQTTECLKVNFSHRLNRNNNGRATITIWMLPLSVDPHVICLLKPGPGGATSQWKWKRQRRKVWKLETGGRDLLCVQLKPRVWHLTKNWCPKEMKRQVQVSV